MGQKNVECVLNTHRKGNGLETAVDARKSATLNLKSPVQVSDYK